MTIQRGSDDQTRVAFAYSCFFLYCLVPTFVSPLFPWVRRRRTDRRDVMAAETGPVGHLALCALVFRDENVLEAATGGSSPQLQWRGATDASDDGSRTQPTQPTVDEGDRPIGRSNGRHPSAKNSRRASRKCGGVGASNEGTAAQSTVTMQSRSNNAERGTALCRMRGCAN